MRSLTFVALLLTLGCDPPPPPTDAGPTADAGPMSADAGPLDAGSNDAGPLDAGPPAADAGPTRFGELMGSCGVLDAAQLTGAEPSLVEGSIDFVMSFVEARDAASLSEGGREILADGNAGGSSVESELIAYEILERCEGAELIKTETEIVYDDPSGKKTDLLVRIDGVVIGVSVTRAVGFPQSDPYPVERARALLEDKLADVLASSDNVSAADAWQKQILFVLAFEPMHVASLVTAWSGIDSAVRADTILWIARTDGDDLFIY